MMKQFLRAGKQLADQTFSRSGKSESLSDELQAADRKVEHVRGSLQALCKRLGGVSAPPASQEPAAREKRLRKLTEYQLGLAMQEATAFEDDSLLKYIMQECSKTEMSLANEIADHESKVEQLVSSPLIAVTEQDLPNIIKAKKQLSRLMGEKDSANSRYNSLLRQTELNPAKVTQAKEEAEEAELRADQARDLLASEMFSLLAKETELANIVLQYIKLQRAYHESALHTLTDTVPHLEKYINDSNVKPVFGFPLEEHLRVTGRTIAFPIELCVCALHELGLLEEGLLRIAPGSSRMKRMKLSLDAGIFTYPLPLEYRDVHVLAGVLKSYLRELPEPLLTHRLHDTFMTAITKNSTEETKIEALAEAIRLLPKANYNNLQYLMKFLSALTQKHSVNKMTPSNIAIVIAPNLLWSGDSGGMGFDMCNTTNLNCIAELLVKHCDRFFKEDINFFTSFSKEDLLPDLCDYGFTPNFGMGTYNQGFNPAVDNHNGDQMSKSMLEYSSHYTAAKPNVQLVQSKQSHSRSNSHDTSLILVDNEMKRTQSNSSLSDHSSPPQGSPKPITRRKNKPLAPVPPNFTPPDKNKNTKSESSPNSKQDKDTKVNNNVKSDAEKPDKPPRPTVSEPMKLITGVQTINRSTYKSKPVNKLVKNFNGSRENLTNILLKERRKSYEFDHENLGKESKINVQTQAGSVQAINQLGSTNKTDSSTNTPLLTKDALSVKTGFLPPKQFVQSADIPAKPMPVAAPRTVLLPANKQENATYIDKESGVEVILRRPSGENLSMGPPTAAKPAIPERPATLRPQSFRNSVQKNPSIEALTSIDISQNGSSGGAGTVLERTHVYNVDKQHPTIITVGNNQEKLTARLSESSPDEEQQEIIQRTHSTGSNKQVKVEGQQTEAKSLTSQMRKLSQSEGNILDVPPSPRAYHKPPRPQIPAPPPPTQAQPRKSNTESTDL